MQLREIPTHNSWLVTAGMIPISDQEKKEEVKKKAIERKISDALIAQKKAVIEMLKDGADPKDIYDQLITKGFFLKKNGEKYSFPEASQKIAHIRFSCGLGKKNTIKRKVEAMILEGKFSEEIKKTLGISSNTLSCMCNKLKIPFPCDPSKYLFNGVGYKSIADAARATGLNETTIRRKLKKEAENVRCKS